MSEGREKEREEGKGERSNNRKGETRERRGGMEKGSWKGGRRKNEEVYIFMMFILCGFRARFFIIYEGETEFLDNSYHIFILPINWTTKKKRIEAKY